MHRQADIKFSSIFVVEMRGVRFRQKVAFIVSNEIIDFEDIKALMDKVPPSVNLTIVGGQAITFWGTLYHEKYVELFEGNDSIVLGTADIDIMASSDAAKICAEAWGASVIFPEIFDETPNTAIVSLNIPGKGIIEIDFLDDYQRLNKVKEAYFSSVLLSQHKPIYVLSQLTLLLAKIGNTLILRRTDIHALGHLRAAVLIVRCYMMSLIDAQELKPVYRAIKLILYLAARRNVGQTLFNNYGIDLLSAIPEDLTSLDARYIENTYNPKNESIICSRNRC